MTPPSPPSSISPIRYTYSRSKRQKEREEKELYIQLLEVLLAKYFSEDHLITFFSKLIGASNRNITLEQKYLVAQSINKIIKDLTLDNAEDRLQVSSELSEAVVDEYSELYKALNYQHNLIPITFFGQRSAISWNYARPLQSAEAIVLNKQAPSTCFGFS